MRGQWDTPAQREVAKLLGRALTVKEKNLVDRYTRMGCTWPDMAELLIHREQALTQQDKTNG